MTKELALKDFCLEPNSKNILRGVHFMAQKLSGSLALVNCRDPLRLSLMSMLK